MPVIGFVSADGSSDQPEGLGHCSFEFALREAATGDSEAFPYPYPLLKGIIDSIQNRDYISVTSILHCLRGEYLKRITPHYVAVEQMYPMFRGTLFHALLEKSPNPNGKVEEKHLRTYRGIEIGGTFDSMVMMQDTDGTIVLQDWKTTNELPKYDSPYSSHLKQINLYRWLLGLDPDKVILEVWYFTMKGVKRCRLKNGRQQGRGGKSPVNQHMTDAQVEAFLDDRLVKLRASLTAKMPMPYVMVDDETKSWECALCPVAGLCEKLRYAEMKSVWRKEAGLPPEVTGTIISLEEGVSKVDGPEVAAEWGNALDVFIRRINAAYPTVRVGTTEIPVKSIEINVSPNVVAPTPKPPTRASPTQPSILARGTPVPKPPAKKRASRAARAA